ncbi:MAG: ATP-binding cassette domain-containing protein [Clostridia bacterium]|nr:ATP-binding cassette domain-containing protein [Clostridia bacterium]
MSDIIVKVENLCFAYMSNDVQVLKDINLTVREGEFVGIIGPSGAGKTTLCYCLKGLIPHTIKGKLRGTIRVCGTDIKKTGPEQMASQVGMVLQDPEGQIIGLTVAEDVAFGPENMEWPREKILSEIPGYLDLVRLSGFEQRETYSLSGGQKQRLAIAGALIMKPRLLILDEPTSELDPLGREEVFRTIRRLRDEGNVTVIVVEQAVEELIEVCDRLVIIDGGQIIADASPVELFKQKELLNRIRGRVRIPQVVELLCRLEESGLIPHEWITPYEDEAVETLSRLMQGGVNY